MANKYDKYGRSYEITKSVPKNYQVWFAHPFGKKSKFVAFVTGKRGNKYHIDDKKKMYAVDVGSSKNANDVITATGFGLNTANKINKHLGNPKRRCKWNDKKYKNARKVLNSLTFKDKRVKKI